MKNLLVISTEYLPYAMENILNSKNDYCAIVTDEVNTAKEFVKKIGLPENLVYPLYELKTLINEIYYDAVICVSDKNTGHEGLGTYVQRCGCPQNKFVHFYIWNDEGNFLVERALRYYEEHSDEFEIFATGNSHTSAGLDVNQFKLKVLTFGLSSQDLYYSYQIAKRVLTPKTGGGARKIRYALIGLNSYTFHTDQSLFYNGVFRLLAYFTAFKDLHNFWMPPEQYQNLLNEKFLSNKLLLDDFDIDNVMLEKLYMYSMTFNAHVNAREKAESWNDKYYPETRNEYVKILDDYLKLCIESKVRPLLVLYPVAESYSKYFCKKLLAEFYHFIEEAVKKYPETIFIDGWKMGFDDSYFRDVDHLNIKGAAKFSALLNNVIEELEKS